MTDMEGYPAFWEIVVVFRILEGGRDFMDIVWYKILLSLERFFGFTSSSSSYDESDSSVTTTCSIG